MSPNMLINMVAYQCIEMHWKGLRYYYETNISLLVNYKCSVFST